MSSLNGTYFYFYSAVACSLRPRVALNRVISCSGWVFFDEWAAAWVAELAA
jgi:hypothetical protein